MKEANSNTAKYSCRMRVSLAYPRCLCMVPRNGCFVWNFTMPFVRELLQPRFFCSNLTFEKEK